MWNFRLIYQKLIKRFVAGTHSIQFSNSLTRLENHSGRAGWAVILSLIVHITICVVLLVHYAAQIQIALSVNSAPARISCPVYVAHNPARPECFSTPQERGRKKYRTARDANPLKTKNKQQALKQQPKNKNKPQRKPTPKPVAPELPKPTKPQEPVPVTAPAPEVKPSPPAPLAPKSTDPTELTLAATDSPSAATTSPGLATLQAHIHDAWKPPRGIVPKAPCTVKVQVGKGRIQGKAEIVTSSGSTAFDMAARQALMAITYPLDFWNRVLVIHFS